MLSNSGEDLDKMISDLHRESLKVGLKMNMKKRKVMYNKHLIGRQRIGNEALELDRWLVQTQSTRKKSEGE